MSWRPAMSGCRSFSSTITFRLASTNAESASTEREGMSRPSSSIDVASTTATSTGFPSVNRPCRTRSGYSPIRQSKNSTDPSFTPLRAISLRYGKRRRTPSRAMFRSKRFVVAPPVRSVSSYRRPASADRASASGISFARDAPPMHENAIEPRSGTNRSTASSDPMTRARRAFDRIRAVIRPARFGYAGLAYNGGAAPFLEPPSWDGEVRLPEILEVEQLGWRTGLDDVAVLHDVPEVGDSQRRVCVLLDHQDGESSLPKLADLHEDLGDKFRRKAQARFVEHENGGLRHQGAADSHHLLLPTTEAAGLHASPLAQPGEELVDIGERLVRRGSCPLRVCAQSEVPLRRQEREQPAALRARGDALVRASVGRHPRDVISTEDDVAAGRPYEPVHDLQRRRFPRSVGPDQDGRRALFGGQRHVPQDLGPVVARMDPIKAQHPSPPCRGT